MTHTINPRGSRLTPAQPNPTTIGNGGVIKARRVGTLHRTPRHNEKTQRRSRAPVMESTMNTLSDPPELSPLEQEVLEEYEVLAENMKKVFIFCSPPPAPSTPHPLPSHPAYLPTSRSPFPHTQMGQGLRVPTGRRIRLTSLARPPPRHPSRGPQHRDPRRPAGPRAQDEPRLHASQG